MQRAEEDHAVRRAGDDWQALRPRLMKDEARRPRIKDRGLGLAVLRRLDRVRLDADDARAERGERPRGLARAAADVDDHEPGDRRQRGDRVDVGACSEMLAFGHRAVLLLRGCVKRWRSSLLFWRFEVSEAISFSGANSMFSFPGGRHSRRRRADEAGVRGSQMSVTGPRGDPVTLVARGVRQTRFRNEPATSHPLKAFAFLQEDEGAPEAERGEEDEAVMERLSDQNKGSTKLRFRQEL